MSKLKKMGFVNSEIYLLHDLVFKLDKYAHAILMKEFDLSYNHFLMLIAISQKHIKNQKDIVEQMNLSKTAVSLRVKELVELKMITQEIDPKHRRQKNISLSSEGKEVLRRAENLLLVEADNLMLKSGVNRDLIKYDLQRLIVNI